MRDTIVSIAHLKMHFRSWFHDSHPDTYSFPWFYFKIGHCAVDPSSTAMIPVLFFFLMFHNRVVGWIR